LDVRAGGDLAVAQRAAVQADRYLADRYLQDAVRRFRQGERRVSHVVLEGEPSAQIVDYAAAARAHLVALTTRGRGELARLALGSVADAVVRSAPCPVLLVRVQDALR